MIDEALKLFDCHCIRIVLKHQDKFHILNENRRHELIYKLNLILCIMYEGNLSQWQLDNLARHSWPGAQN